MKYQTAVPKVRSIVELKFVGLKTGLRALAEEAIKKRLKNMIAEQIKALPIVRKV